MCEVPLDDWANGDSVDVFFTYGFVVIRLGVYGLKKIEMLYLLDLFLGKGQERRCKLACVKCF